MEPASPVVLGPWTVSLGKLALAALLGAVIGLDREHSGKPAGLRTNMLICIGAALLTELSIGLAASWDPPGPGLADPGRIAAQIVSGMAVGAGAWALAVAATGLVVLTLFLLGRVELRLTPLTLMERTLRITVPAGAGRIAALEQSLRDSGLRVGAVGFERAAENRVLATIHAQGRQEHWDAALNSLLADPDTVRLSLE
jgi:uncharacterized membrane protein YhiD involved in acid resistance